MDVAVMWANASVEGKRYEIVPLAGDNDQRAGCELRLVTGGDPDDTVEKLKLCQDVVAARAEAQVHDIDHHRPTDGKDTKAAT
jgi:hypothetical protein